MIESPVEENVPIRHKEEPTKVLKRKQEKQNKEECELDLYAQHKGIQSTLTVDVQNISLGIKTNFSI